MELKQKKFKDFLRTAKNIVVFQDQNYQYEIQTLL